MRYQHCRHENLTAQKFGGKCGARLTVTCLAYVRKRLNANVPWMLIRQPLEKIPPNIVALEHFCVLRKSEPREPRRDVVHENACRLNDLEKPHVKRIARDGNDFDLVKVPVHWVDDAVHGIRGDGGGHLKNRSARAS